jgi:hypothetical protein
LNNFAQRTSFQPKQAFQSDKTLVADHTGLCRFSVRTGDYERNQSVVWKIHVFGLVIAFVKHGVVLERYQSQARSDCFELPFSQREEDLVGDWLPPVPRAFAGKD